MLLAFITMVVALGIAAYACYMRSPWRPTAGRPPTALRAAKYVPFTEATNVDALVVDCTHPSAPTFTHHKASNNPPGLPPADTSTGLILNALRCRHASAEADAWLSHDNVTVNHFDGDALFSVWCVINPGAAMHYEEVLRTAAALHDFREAALGAPGADAALALCCWINSIERSRFSPPYEDKDADDKFAFFLRELGPFLEAPEKYRRQWEEEYAAVLRDWEAVRGAVTVHKDIGLAVVRAPRPVHYYGLFSPSLGCDTVLSLYDGQRYELEGKYTQFVSVHSRPVQARLETGPLAAALNRVDLDRAPGSAWGTPTMLDTGPLLRLDLNAQKLAKRQRYGHPTARPIYASGLAPAQMERVVVSYLRHGLRGTPPRGGGWSWDELLAVNAGIDWASWEAEELPALASGA